MNEANAAVTLGADVGGKDAHAATAEACMTLRQSLARECRGPYGNSIAEFALIARIDGAVQSWGRCGVDNVRIQRKSGYATADIFVPKEVWLRGAEPFRAFLTENIQAALQAIIDRSEKAKHDVEADRLMADVRRALERA